MKKIIIALIVVIIVFSFTLPLFATDKNDAVQKDKGTNVDNGNLVAYWSSIYIKNGQDFGSGNPAHGVRGAEIQSLLGH